MIVAPTHASIVKKSPRKVNSFVKKGNHGGSHQTECDIRHLKNNCTEEGYSSVKDSLKAVELKEEKHDEEVMEIVE